MPHKANPKSDHHRESHNTHQPLKAIEANTVIIQTTHLSRGHNHSPKPSKFPSKIWNYLGLKCESVAAGKFLDFEM